MQEYLLIFHGMNNTGLMNSPEKMQKHDDAIGRTGFIKNLSYYFNAVRHICVINRAMNFYGKIEKWIRFLHQSSTLADWG